MYYKYFGLSGAPFPFNPSSPALFMSAGHREGMAALEWGLQEPSGFTMLVGEIGTGKTTLICSLLARRHQGVRTVWVANPRLSFEEMLRQMLGQLGADHAALSGKLALLEAFDAQLASLGPAECIAVIVDEAQALSDTALEDLRLLSNFQKLEARRLQIVLVGQIDLARRLAEPRMRQLNQRIGARALLPTLRGSEIRDYVDYRLRAQGGNIGRLFTRGAIRELARTSNGIPRRINALCHNALLLAYAQEKDCVGRRHIRDAAHDYDHLLVIRAPARTKMVGSVSTYVALGLLCSALFGFFQLRPLRAGFSIAVASLAAQATALRSPTAAERPPVQPKNEARLTAPNQTGPAQFSAGNDFITGSNESIAMAPAEEFALPPPAISAEGNLKAGTAATIASAKPAATANVPPSPESPVAGHEPVAGAAVVVKTGDTLNRIAMKLYGSLGTDELRRLTAANPQITNANMIYPGQSIRVQRASK